jgi:hypothetical protein
MVTNNMAENYLNRFESFEKKEKTEKFKSLSIIL